MEGQLIAMPGRALDDASLDYVRAAKAALNDAYRLAGYLLGDAVEAEDAVQDALIKAWRCWPSLRDQAAFGPWFDRIVVNVCRDRMRRHRSLRMIDLESVGEIESADVFGSTIAHDEVDVAVSRLTSDHRVVIAMRFGRDMTLEQVAETLGLPLGTVKSRLHYALAALRVELKGMER
jgi:RNA polymerase sigma-70 factor (ECF subfamily)